MASISFRNVTKIYDGADKPVVPNLNLEIADKEFIILVGPSGCGKTVWSTRFRPKTATSRWFSRTTPCTPT